MILRIQARLVELSPSNTVSLIAALDIQRSRNAVNDWVRKLSHSQSKDTELRRALRDGDSNR